METCSFLGSRVLARMKDDRDVRDDRTRAASAALAMLITDLSHRGLLVGEVRESVGESIELFRTTRTSDPYDAWNSDLVDIYEELRGHQPEAPERDV